MHDANGGIQTLKTFKTDFAPFFLYAYTGHDLARMSAAVRSEPGAWPQH